MATYSMGVEMVKAEVDTARAVSGEFPKLMVASDGEIVLFVDYGKGMVVNGGKENAMGAYSSSWVMDCFQHFTGTVTLSNEG